MGARQVVRLALLTAALLALACPVMAAEPHDRRRIDVPRASLADSLNILARQAGVTLGGVQPGMDSVQGNPVRGTLSAEQALGQLLAGTPYTYRRLANHAFRVIRRPPADTQNVAERPEPVVTGPVRTPGGFAEPEIVVVASKRQAQLSTYQGSATVIPVEGVSPARLSGGTQAIASILPTFATTSLGPGRNKVFVRGFADSSFNGPTQSTTSIYLDEYRLVYSAPDPDLRAVDLESLNLLEGPQGTLYGAGALGGTLRIQREAPELGKVYADASAQLSHAQGGSPAYSLSAVANTPVFRSGAARFVAYHQQLPGYIDDTGRGLQDINKTTILGWRASYATTLRSDWAIRVDALDQDLDTADGQYAEPAVGAFARRSAVAQPFRSDVALVGVTATKNWGARTLVSATNWTESDLESRFDLDRADLEGRPLFFEELRRIGLLNHETRATGSSLNYDWVGGFSALYNDDRRTQISGSEAATSVLERLDTSTAELAVFGELNRQVSSRLDLTVGVRFVHSWVVTELAVGEDGEIDPERLQFQVLPTAALGYQLDNGWYTYAKYQEGFRPGGSNVTGVDASSPEVEDFESDEVSYYEIGARGSLPKLRVPSLSVSLSYAKWVDIQSDILVSGGLPSISNIGNGNIYSANLALAMNPWPGATLEGKVFLSRSDVTAADGLGLEEAEFPNIPEFAATVSARQVLMVRERSRVTVGVDYSFVGESFLALQRGLELDQGGYSVSNLWLDYGFGPNSLSLSLRNLFNNETNRFAFGNPFTLVDRPQSTPLQPRTVSLTISRRF